MITKDILKDNAALFTIDKNLVRNADKDAIILHCLPAYRSKEITNEIMYQIRNTKSLTIDLKKLNNNIKKMMPFHSIIWKSWYRNKDGKYTTRQPYFGNTYNTINLRPKNETYNNKRMIKK